MDKKKKMTLIKRALMLWMTVIFVLPLQAQNVASVKFCGDSINEKNGEITLFLKFLDNDGKGIPSLGEDIIKNYNFYEKGELIDWNRKGVRIEHLFSGKRIPSGYTFSVLIDLNIPQDGKNEIYETLRKLVESTIDSSSVYISFFGDDVSSTELITARNYSTFKEKFDKPAQQKWFYDAVFCKLAEFNNDTDSLSAKARLASGYQSNRAIANRAEKNRADKHSDKNILIVFTECSTDFEFNILDYIAVTDYQRSNIERMPKVYAYYYTGSGKQDDDAKETLDLLANYDELPQDRKGQCLASENMDQLIRDLGETIGNQMYDYAFTYPAMQDCYDGETEFIAMWGNTEVGKDKLEIGTKEHPWYPPHIQTWADIAWMVIGAFLTVLLTICFFILVMKALIPWIKSRIFAAKYYKKYDPENDVLSSGANVRRRSCHYCKQALEPGQIVVTKCDHIMHLHCWKTNKYKCAEYGQNCNTGIQEHVDWNDLFTKHTLQDSKLTIAGIVASLVAWVIYLLSDSGTLFSGWARPIVNTFYKVQGQNTNFTNQCLIKVASFMAIGLLLSFFLSIVFRYYDEYRTKNWKVLLKIFGLSLLSGIIGLAAFALGGCILCAWLPSLNTTHIPWYCSLPAYLLFSICTALSLTIKSSVPVKSAMLGGLCSAIIGFIVLYFAEMAKGYGMLLNFIIYGGGLGASLLTVRALAEKYFLVIQNGVKAGQRIPIHKWMNATGGGNKVTIGMTGDCEIQMNWEKSNKVAKEHAQLYIDQTRSMPVIKPLANGVVYNTRAELPVGKPSVLTNGDTFKIGDTIFKYEETD